MSDTKIGLIVHYFDKIQVAVLSLTDASVKVGDQIRLGDEATGFTQTIDSMQVDHNPVTEAAAGSEVGLKVEQPVKKGDIVYKVEQ